MQKGESVEAAARRLRYEFFDSLECDYVATGHYAKIEKDEETGRYLLKKSVTDKKDQTYALYNMTQEIRNTTNDINDNADMILESESLEEDKECAREIKGITSKFNSMTNELFDVSKLDAANIKVYNSIGLVGFILIKINIIGKINSIKPTIPLRYKISK